MMTLTVAVHLILGYVRITALAMNISQSIAIDGKQHLVMFSFDLTGPEFIMRMLSSVGRM